MSLKLYGIYLAYPPNVNLHIEGLGRHLIEFLKAAQKCNDARFCIALPSWSRKNILQLFQEYGIDPNRFEFISPRHQPILLTLFYQYSALKKHRKIEYFKKIRNFLSRIQTNLVDLSQRKMVSIRNPMLFALFFTLLLCLGLTGIIKLIVIKIAELIKKLKFKIDKYLKVRFYFRHLDNTIRNPKKTPFIIKLFSLMMKAELSLLNKLICDKNEVAAWYCPTAFWPQFNDIPKPCIMCVPDVIPADFPIGFALGGDDLQLTNFKELEKSIAGGQHFITYSEHVKWQSLVRSYHVLPDKINVIRNGTNELTESVCIYDSNNEPDDEATDSLCRPMIGFNNMAGRFIFYASQFRPHKNIISLLRAYNYLLKKNLINHKLVLTGNLDNHHEIARFISEHSLVNEVICLYNLSTQQLGACYRLADLAVNPSLSEGGFPFTFSEALSVNTPVIMGRIPVTEEVITCPELQELMLFDPYNWQDIAKYIQSGLKNQSYLLKKQKIYYDEFVRRKWSDVVTDYIALLDRISSK